MRDYVHDGRALFRRKRMALLLIKRYSPTCCYVTQKDSPAGYLHVPPPCDRHVVQGNTAVRGEKKGDFNADAEKRDQGEKVPLSNEIRTSSAHMTIITTIVKSDRVCIARAAVMPYGRSA